MTEADFTLFWQHWPHRIARGAARTALAKALKKTDMGTIVAAIQIYIRCKPEDRPWCLASTWLNQERWADEWEPPQTIQPQPLYRAARSVDELKQYLRSIGKAVTIEIEKAREVSELPAFARMVPVTWNQH